jgi:hypothetical protein
MTRDEIKAALDDFAAAGNAVEAARQWLARNKGPSRPAGRWDGAGRYYPSDDERRECCDDIRRPSRAYPYSLWAHVHSAVHVAALHDVDPANVRRAANLLTRLAELDTPPAPPDED